MTFLACLGLAVFNTMWRTSASAGGGYSRMVQELSEPGTQVKRGYFSACTDKSADCFPRSQGGMTTVEKYNNSALCGDAVCDFAAADISITWSRKRDYNAEYSSPWFDSGMVVFARHHAMYENDYSDPKALWKRGSSLGNAFSPNLWIALLLIPVFSSIVFWLVENDQTRKNILYKCAWKDSGNNFSHHYKDGGIVQHTTDDGKNEEKPVDVRFLCETKKNRTHACVEFWLFISFLSFVFCFQPQLSDFTQLY